MIMMMMMMMMMMMIMMMMMMMMKSFLSGQPTRIIVLLGLGRIVLLLRPKKFYCSSTQRRIWLFYHVIIPRNATSLTTPKPIHPTPS